MAKYLKSLQKNKKIGVSAIVIALIVCLLAGIFAIKLISIKTKNENVDTEVLVYGATLGGISSALTAGSQNVKTILVSEDNIIGGQAVASGISAFDESRRSWENYSIYKDLKTYIKDKYSITDIQNYGLGNAVIGSLSTLPSDVEEFFNKKISENKNISLLKNYELISIKKVDTKSYSEAIIKNKTSNEQKTIKFKYLVDGTQTGKAFAIAGSDYNIGFDKKESTNEPSAMSEQVRSYFTDGIVDKSGKYGEFGNRVQPISMVVSLLDKGFDGDFYQADITANDCIKTENNTGFMKTSTIFQTIREKCQLEFKMHPVFSDVYDVYFINNKNTSFNLDIIDTQSTDKVTVPKQNIQAQVLEKLGTFYLDNNKDTTYRFSNLPNGFKVEGLILVKKNQPLNTNLSNLQTPGNPADLASIRLDYKSGIAQAKWGLSSLPLEEESYFYNGLTSISWNLKTAASRKYDVSINWYAYYNRSKKVNLRINETATNKEVANTFFSERDKNRNGPVPIVSFDSEAGKDYTITLENKENNYIDLAEIQIKPAAIGSSFKVSADKDFTLSSVNSGLYDIWVKSKDKSNIHYTIGNNIKDFSYTTSNIFALLDRDFLINNNLKIKGDKDLEIYLTPVASPNIYVKNFADTDSLDLSGLIGGIYNGYLVFDNPPSNLSGQFTSIGTKDLNFTQLDKYLHINQDLLVKDSSSKIQLNTRSSGQLILFDKIPENYDVQNFKVEKPLLTQTDPSQPIYTNQTFFNYRNIISPTNLITKSFDDKILSDVSKNTLGLSILATSSNDYSPIYTNAIDSLDNISQAKKLSYGYYYWLRYDYPKVSQALGCDILDQPLCSSKRVELDLNTFNTEDGFPISAYYREGRRLNTVNPIKEQDLIRNYIICDKEKCDDSNCYFIYPDNSACLSKTQTPILSNDAVAAAYYVLDFHSYVSREEENHGQMQRFLSYLRNHDNLLGKNDTIIFNRYQESKPAEITLGSLIPANGSNIFPGSTNLGVTQITNSMYRTHSIEISIGVSTGYLLSYAIKNNISPTDILKTPIELKKYQDFIIGQGVVIYPIDDMNMYDELQVKAIQYIILQGKLNIAASLEGQKELLYYVHGDKYMDLKNPLVKEIKDNLDTRNKKGMLIDFYGLPKNISDDDLIQKAKDLGLRPKDTINDNILKYMTDKPTDEFLYKLIYLKDHEAK
jgi:hypothetical protein